MRLINRQAVSVRKKKPFLDWLNRAIKTYDPPEWQRVFRLEEINYDCQIYLIEEFEHMSSYYDYIDDLKPLLFESELSGWYNASASNLWPQDRSAAVFDEWFTVELHSMVIDVEQNRLKKDKHLV